MPPKGLCVGEQVEGGLDTHPCAGVNMIEVYLQLDTEEKLLGGINGLRGLRLKTGGCRGPGNPRFSVLPSVLPLSEPGPRL